VKRKEKRRERKTHITDLKRRAKDEREETAVEAVTPAQKQQRRRTEAAAATSAAVDLTDSRFAARLTNPAFQVDPADRRFREDRASAIVDAKQLLLNDDEEASDSGGGLVAKLKNKAQKWKKIK